MEAVSSSRSLFSVFDKQQPYFINLNKLLSSPKILTVTDDVKCGTRMEKKTPGGIAQHSFGAARAYGD